MNKNTKDKILKTIETHYSESNDFNGYPIIYISEKFKLVRTDRDKLLVELIRAGKISLNFGDIYENAYIKAFPEEKPEIQINKLKTIDTIHTCAYPTTKHLINAIDVEKFHDRPFSRKLALGQPQLSFEIFDLSILEYYRNDPRYSYFNDDISGNISIIESESNQINKSDEVFLHSFGFSHNSKGHRAVAVCLRYLSFLNSEHQYIWWAKRIENGYKVHPDYIKIILGDWDIGISIFSAFLKEMKEINKLSKMLERPPFFNNEISEDNRPKEFSFLVRPTSKEFNGFIMILDKLISENINKKFFKNDIVDSDKKGTIRILDEWLDRLFYKSNKKQHKVFINLFKEIRRLRNNAAHRFDDDVFDQDNCIKQKDLIEKAYRGLQAIRIILSSNPKCRDYKVPKELEIDDIYVN